MICAQEIYDLIKKANEEQTKKLSEKSDEGIKLIQEEIRRTVKEIQEKIDLNANNITNLKNKQIIIERKLRRNNIVIFGLQVVTENLIQDTLTKINNLLEVDIHECDINNIYSVNHAKKSTIVVEFVSFLKKQQLFSKVSKLKNTGITIANDLSYEEREERKVLKHHQQLARLQNLEAKIKGSTLIIDNQIYTVEDLRKLENPNASEGDLEEDTGPEKETEVLEASEAIIEESNLSPQPAEDLEKGSLKKTHTLKQNKGKIFYNTTQISAVTSGGSMTTRSKYKYGK